MSVRSVLHPLHNNKYHAAILVTEAYVHIRSSEDPGIAVLVPELALSHTLPMCPVRYFLQVRRDMLQL